MSTLIIRRDSPSSLLISWSGLPSKPYPFVWYIERAGAYTGPWVAIAGPISDHITYQDTAVERGVRYFYRLRIDHVGQGAEVTYIPSSGGATYGPEETLLVAEVRRRIYQDLYWGKSLALYYPVKTSGQFCSCYDTTRQRKGAKCLSCYGTGYVGGFYNPIVLPFRDMPKQEDNPEVARTQGSRRRVFFPGLFAFHKGDVFVDSVRDFHVVSTADVVRSEGAIVKQAVTASLVPNDHLYHNLPVDLSLLDKPAQLMVEAVS